MFAILLTKQKKCTVYSENSYSNDIFGFKPSGFSMLSWTHLPQSLCLDASGGNSQGICYELLNVLLETYIVNLLKQIAYKSVNPWIHGHNQHAWSK